MTGISCDLAKGIKKREGLGRRDASQPAKNGGAEKDNILRGEIQAMGGKEVCIIQPWGVTGDGDRWKKENRNLRTTSGTHTTFGRNYRYLDLNRKAEKALWLRNTGGERRSGPD